MSSATTPPARRNRALVIADIVVSVLVLAFALTFGLYSFAFVGQLATLSTSCGDDCNGLLLGIATYGLLAVTVLGFFLAVGFVVVRLVQKRFTWPWPVGALVVMIVAFYIAAWLAGAAVPAS